MSRGGDSVTVLAPHTAGLDASWEDADGVRVRAFRYAPEVLEVLGYGRSLEADERPRALAAAVAPLYLRGARRAVAGELKRHRYDVVQAHWIVPNAVALSWPRPWKSTWPPLVIGLHGSDVFMAEKPGVRRLAARALARARMLTGCSPELVERVCALGYAKERSRVIPYGIDPGHFAPGEDAHGWRRRLGVPEDACVFLGVGRMATKKGFHVLVEVVDELLARCPDAWLVLAGGGDLESQLRSRCEGLRVRFAGAVERDVLPDLYRSADVFVLPAVHDPSGNVDGLPNVILEAMASALPVVASGISGIPLAVENGVTGLLVREKRGEELLKALVRLGENSEERRAFGRAGLERVLSELTWDQIADRYRDAYLVALGA